MEASDFKERHPSIDDIELQDDNPLSRPRGSRSSRSQAASSSSYADTKRAQRLTSFKKVSSGEQVNQKTSQADRPPVPSKPMPPPPPTAPRTEATKKDTNDDSDIYAGKKSLQYGIWAHYMGYGSSMLCFWFGITAISWSDARFYGCRVDGEFIHSDYIVNSSGTCAATYHSSYVCCDPDDSPKVDGNASIGVLYLLYGLGNVLIENCDWGFGMWFPNNLPFFDLGISPLGILHMLIGVVGLADYATCLAGVALISTGVVYTLATCRKETGDGGRQQRRKARAKLMSSPMAYVRSFLPDFSDVNLNPIEFVRRIYNEDKLSSYFWMCMFCAMNFIVFVYTLYTWSVAVDDIKDDLLNGTLKIACDTKTCSLNRQIIRSGPFSGFAPWAKACGGCLNLNCSLILLPVIRLIIRKLNNAGTSYSRFQGGGILTRFFAHPVTRYIPLQKNIEFHKICALAVLIFASGHTIFHCLNLSRASETTLARFRWLGWDGTDFLTGAIVLLSMFFIYSAAPDIVRNAKFEIFFTSHHFFVVFFFVLFLHGPVFVYWAIVPVTLYIIERYLQTKRGNQPYVVTKVEWIPPVMAIQFRPIIKEQFQFKEGQYLYLNCPYISQSEWHPFTISSAYDDLNNGPRVFLETGEEVKEVPRPSNWPAGAKWNKYCLVSQDYTKIPHEFLIEKSETGYHDYISLHIKVHGLDEPKAKSWTRKLKEYFELMNPGDTADGRSQGKFPFYFTRRDPRGDILLGRQYGPDGQQILRVDGPHSAPAEHYTNYGTIMLIGAGIGLTPCVSILCALTKYRWKKNFTPEIVHFYWIVRHNEIDSFQWLIHTLAEMEYNLLKLRSTGQVEPRYYCEINIFVTAAGKDHHEPKPLFRPSGVKPTIANSVAPMFTAEQLYEGMLNPTMSSKGMVDAMKSSSNPPNRCERTSL